MIVAHAGSRLSSRANVARGTRAITTWSMTYGTTDEQIPTPAPASSQPGWASAPKPAPAPAPIPNGVMATAATSMAAPSWSIPPHRLAARWLAIR